MSGDREPSGPNAEEARHVSAVEQTKSLICDLMKQFYDQGWCSGTGGGISIRVDPQTIVMAPSGVQKERMKETDLFVLSSNFKVACPPITAGLKLSECAPLFQAAYEVRGAGAVLHSHALSACLVTTLPSCATEWAITGFEMIKGIKGHRNTDVLTVPVIDNTEREAELTEKLRRVIELYPRTFAVLVRHHGVYIWGDSWQHAKTQAECYHYLFELTWQLHLGGQWPQRR